MTTRVPSLLDRLAVVGRALHGPDWQAATARSLGPWHPAGARERLDERLVRRWVSGDRPVPGWVEASLPRMIAFGVALRRAEIAALEATAAGLGLSSPGDVALAAMAGEAAGVR